MSLWPHQERALAEIETAIESGERRICVTSPTGGGKTRIMAELIRAHESEGVILYTNRKMLREQTSDVMEAAGIDHGVRAAGTKPALLRNVQVSSIQTEHSRVVKRKKWELHEAKLVLIDEAHNQKEETAREIMRRHLEQGSTIIGFTATPLDIGELYDHLIVAGTNSELRECGAHVPAQTYGPDEPDLRHIKKYQVGDDLSQGDNVKAMMRPGIFGRVFEWWKRLNPEAQPALLFAPGVKESVWFAEEFRKMGVRAAHIDGDNVWIDGETIPSDREAREQVLSESRSGNIKIICNRFVMREGIDAPWLYHGIFATVFGSLTSFLQSGGRLLRAYPGLDHVCIARDTPVLTDRGLVKIQEVTTSDLVWDGLEFVSHDGPTCMGHNEVIEWDGLTATPEHKVHTNHGWTTIAAAACGRERLTRSGIGGNAVWVLDDSDPYNALEGDDARSESALLKVWQEVVQAVSQDRKACASWLRALLAQIWGSLPRVDLSPCSTSMAAMQRPEGHYLPPLWRAWNQIQICLGVRWGLLDCCEPWSAYESQTVSRQNRQRWELRAGQSPLGNCCAANKEPGQDRQEKLSLPSILGGVSRRWIRAYVSGLSFPRGSDREADRRTMAETWDIVNAGPRHRFTAAGILVGNCIQDHGGNWHRHGSLNADREWELSLTNRIACGEFQERCREENAAKSETKSEGIACAKCSRIRSSGHSCPYCGHVSPLRTRAVVQIDGSLKPQEGDVHKQRVIRQAPDTERIWRSTYMRAKNSRNEMTFRQAEGLFFYENHYYPPRDLPFMPIESRDWYAKVKDVPASKLTGFHERANA